MNLYIKVKDGAAVDHPITEDNLMEAFGLSEVTQGFLDENSFSRFEHVMLPASVHVTEENGYEMCNDGIVRPSLVTRELTQEERIDLWVRRPRDYELAQSDWTQAKDSPLTAEKQAEWAAFRQELRDMPTKYANIKSPDEIVPPVRPSK